MYSLIVSGLLAYTYAVLKEESNMKKRNYWPLFLLVFSVLYFQ